MMTQGNMIRTKLAVGYFMTENPDDPASFAELARRYAPRLREVFFPWPGLANGREHIRAIPHEEERLIADLRYCREHGMKLDLLANATCYGEKAVTEEQRLQITGIIRRLDKEGLYPEIITTTSPYIAKLCKVYFPDIEVRASVNMELRNTLALEYLSPLFDSFYICRSVQRDLPTFHMMADWCSGHGKKLCMLVNSGCLRDCPWRTFHYTFLFHKTYHELLPEMTNYNLDLVCNQLFGKHRFPEFLRSGWIRPEDIHVFEPELETIKVSTRMVNNAFEIVEAYLNESYDGNLLRIIDPAHSFGFRPYRVDNKSFPADWVTSGIAGKCAENCVHCGRCEMILKQVLKYDIDPSARMDGFSLNSVFSLRAPARKDYSGLNFTNKKDK